MYQCDQIFVFLLSTLQALYYVTGPMKTTLHAVNEIAKIKTRSKLRFFFIIFLPFVHLSAKN